MKFSLSWLKTWLDTDAPLEAIVETLSAIGLEVEGVENRATALAPFVIAEVIEALPHPNADRLRACRVNAGGAEMSVVCGAPNARTGLKVVFAPPGAFIPGSGITLKVGEIRGVKSEGMLVSFRELGLGEDHEGIIELPEDAPVGMPYALWAGMDDPVIDISVTPNRGDALAVRGVARDLAAAGLGSLKPLVAPSITGTGTSTIIWKNQFPEACPYILGRTVRGVTNGESPDWLKARLTSIGLRPINALVDITNLFTIDLGRPLHVFDADKVAGSVLTLRRGNGESFAGLHGKPVMVTSDDCVIADSSGVQSLAGIVGGEATGCDESTKNVFIECALFDRVKIAQTGQRHAIFSDARQRFERGIDSMLLPVALDAATSMVMDICGGTPSLVTEAGEKPDWNRKASLRFARLKEFGGADVLPDEAVASLEKLGFTIYRRDGQHVELDVPSWRNDIASPPALDQREAAGAEKAAAGAAEIEPEHDLIEEVLRLRGLDAIVPVSLPVPSGVPAAMLTAKQARTALARRMLAARGLMECVTFSFLDHNIAGLFGEAKDLRLANPIAADLDEMRPTPVATLALAAARNVARGYGDLGFFEVGPAYMSSSEQLLVAAGIRTGETALSAIQPPRKYDAMDAKADALALLSCLGVPVEAVTATADAPKFYHPGQSGVLRQGPKIVLGQFGTLHPSLCAKLDLPLGSVAFEVFLDAIAEPKRRKKAAPALPPFQPIRRDFAFLVSADTPADALLRAAKGAERNLVSHVALFDRYAGKNLPEGQISLAIAVTIQPTEKTLTEAELDAISAKIIAAVGKATGGVLRG
ncbi:MAG: phenylalanine--tRNA ligase subunit beta [Acidocella sp. 20-57-95]|nr:MAG: phenylalanine--tRNA ligase subunit beta [Acidocella sp. 20-57-95]OYV60103.1 MAG: phenylalanine--tRNA ligase subunit beta [Acidocella sp. 21-58-7]HQT64609.1 phenylalanine--tRNA ligase subunit beta [Acidocella sp.]HQU04274.1 phenylalanine--tRNA ligase subunit beta [Acidocella sp.]